MVELHPIAAAAERAQSSPSWAGAGADAVRGEQLVDESGPRQVAIDVYGDGRRLTVAIMCPVDLRPMCTAVVYLPSVDCHGLSYRVELHMAGSPWPGWHGCRLGLLDPSNTPLIPYTPAFIYGRPGYPVPSVTVAGAAWPGDPVRVYAVMMRVDR